MCDTGSSDAERIDDHTVTSATFIVTLADVKEYLQRRYWNTRKYRLTQLGCWLVLPVAITAGLTWAALDSRLHQGRITLPLLWAGGWFVVYPALELFRRHNAAKKLVNVLSSSSRFVSVSSERITRSSVSGDTQTFWTEIKGTEVADTIVLVDVLPTGTLIIPRRAFNDTSHFERFISLLRCHVTGTAR